MKKEKEKPWYGLNELDDLQHEFHTDILQLLTSKKYEDLAIDDCMVVFGRLYSIYVLSELVSENKIRFVREEGGAE